MPNSPAPAEISRKLDLIRSALDVDGIAAVRLRGVDWFSWITAGGSSTVILTSESGVAEVLVTRDGAWVMTDAIEAARLREEELPPDSPITVWERPWADPPRTEDFVAERALGGKVVSDRPGPGEFPLPSGLLAAKRRLLPAEIERYRILGREAAEAMTEVLQAARPEWTELELQAAGAAALWKRGIHPTLALAAGNDRAGRYRHPTPTSAQLGRRAMLVFCARRHGLYANLTRWVYFDEPTSREVKLSRDIARVEEEAFRSSRPGARLDEVYQSICQAYARCGHPGEHLRHHQGGTTGYLSREVVATSFTSVPIEESTALAWNPSLPGTKIEDTVLSTSNGIEVLTADPRWPVFRQDGRARPGFWVRP